MKQTCVAPGGKPTQAKFDRETKQVLDSFEKEFGAAEETNKGPSAPLFVRGGVQSAGLVGSQIEEKPKGEFYTPLSILKKEVGAPPKEELEEDLNPYLKYENRKQKKDGGNIQEIQQPRINVELDKREFSENLELEHDEAYLHQILAKYGQVLRLARRAIYFPDHLEAELLAYVTFSSIESATAAMTYINDTPDIKFSARYGYEPDGEMARLFKMLSPQYTHPAALPPDSLPGDNDLIKKENDAFSKWTVYQLHEHLSFEKAIHIEQPKNDYTRKLIDRTARYVI